jgi:Contractile injection system tube protein
LINETLITTFPNSTKSSNFAYLLNTETGEKWEFLYNPTEESFSKYATYVESPTALTYLPKQEYQYTKGSSRTFRDLLIQGFCYGKSIDQYISKLESLMKADPKNGKYTPPEVYFIWGEYRFGAAYLVSIDGSYSLRLSGKPAEGKISITLVETAEKKPTPLSNTTKEATRVLSGNTVRQVTGAKLIQRIRRIINTTANPVRGQQFTLELKDGEVQIINSNRTILGVGKADGTIIYN